MDYGIDIVEGVINDTVARKFEVSAGDGTRLFTGRNPITPGGSVNKGWWSKSELPLDQDTLHIDHFALNANHKITLIKDLTWPKIKVRISLPDVSRYVLSEFYVTGHFRIEKFNMVHLKKSVPPASFLKVLNEGKPCKIGDLRIEKLAEPAIKTVTVTSALGDFVSVDHTQSMEI